MKNASFLMHNPQRFCGGRPRYLWLATPQQRAVLQFVTGLVEGQGACLIPQETGTYRRWKEQTYRQLRDLGLGRQRPYAFHDLRRSFIADEITQQQAKGLSAEEAAKLVAKAVGHNRTEVLKWYLDGTLVRS